MHFTRAGSVACALKLCDRSKPDQIARERNIDDLALGIRQDLVDQKRAGLDLVYMGSRIALQEQMLAR